MLAGEAPVAATDRVVGVQLVPLQAVRPDVSPRTCQVIEQAMAMQADLRPQTVDDFLCALGVGRAVEAVRAVPAPGPAWPPPAVAAPMPAVPPTMMTPPPPAATHPVPRLACQLHLAVSGMTAGAAMLASHTVEAASVLLPLSGLYLAVSGYRTGHHISLIAGLSAPAGVFACVSFMSYASAVPLAVLYGLVMFAVLVPVLRASAPSAPIQPERAARPAPLRFARLLHPGVAILATLWAASDVDMVVVSGPLLTLSGLYLLVAGARAGDRTAATAGLSGPVVSITCLVLIVSNEWGPREAREPILLIGSLYCALLLSMLAASFRRGETRLGVR